MRHAKPRRYRGSHRASVDPKKRYTIAVSPALVGAGVIGVGAGSALPQPGSGIGDATLRESTPTGGRAGVSGQEVMASPTVTPGSTPNQGRAAVLTDGVIQRRTAAPAPEKLPDWVSPAEGYITSIFGLRFGGTEFHKGLDIAGPMGTPIRAAAAGAVIISERQGGYGNLVAVDHGGGVTTYYAHNSKLVASVGEKVQPGDVIALMGSTGQSTGSHVHFEVRVAGERINPMLWMHGRGVDI